MTSTLLNLQIERPVFYHKNQTVRLPILLRRLHRLSMDREHLQCTMSMLQATRLCLALVRSARTARHSRDARLGSYRKPLQTTLILFIWYDFSRSSMALFIITDSVKAVVQVVNAPC